MLFNKNEVRKASEKKVLHKSGKNWIVLSSALLLALAGGAAVSSQTSANADNTNQANVQQNENQFLNNVDNNNTINANNNSTIHSLVGNDLVNAPASASTKAKSAAKVSSASSQWYWKWNGGSAQSHYANASSDADLASNENKVVNSYVKSVNAKFPSQTSSLDNNLGNATSKLNNDKSLAASYSDMANNSNYSSEVSSLAASAGMTYSAYVQSVGATASYNTSATSSASDAASQMNVVNSYAQEINNIYNNSAAKENVNEQEASANNVLFNAQRYYSNASAALSAYNLAIGNSKADSLAEKVALNDSVMDANYVQSVADQLGAPSAVVSNEVRSLAENANEIGISRTGNVSSGDDASNFADNHYVLNASSDGHHHYTFSTYYLNNAENSNGANVIEFNANNKSVPVANYNPDLVRVVSNTAVMNGFNSNAAMNNSEIARYNSAKATVNAAKTSLDDARTTANLYDVLASAADAKTSSAALDYIFGNGKSGAASLLDRGSYNDAYNIINYNTTSYSDAATPTTVTNALSSASNYYNGLSSVASSASGSVASEYSDISSLASSLKTAVRGGHLAGQAIDWMNNGATGIAQARNYYHALSSDLASTIMNMVNGVPRNQKAHVVENSLDSIVNSYSDVNSSEAYASSSQASLDSSVASDFKTGMSGNTVSSLNSQVSSVANSIRADAGVEGNSKANAVVGAMSGIAYSALSAKSGHSMTASLNTASEISSAASSENSVYGADSANSASYANDKNANMVLANSYATSYSADVKADNNAVSSAATVRENFYVDHAGSGYASAEYKASSAASAEVNDRALAQAYGINVYNNTPKYIRAIRGVQIHSDTNFGSKADKKVGAFKAGQEMTVEGIGLDVHGALRYNVYYHGANYFVSGNANYVQPTFLPAENNVSIVVNKPVKEYVDANFSKSAGKTLNTNAQVSGDVVRMDNFNNGFTRVHLSNGNYISANTNYVAVVANNDDRQNNINGQNINHYINNANNTNNNNDAPITWGI